MQTTDFLKVFENPNNNGILLFVLGFLFTLSVYHFLLFFQNKDKVYLYYAFYTSLIFINYLNLVSDGFLKLFVKPFLPFLNSHEVFFKWLYNCVYFVFAFAFVETKNVSVKLYRLIMYPIYGLLIVGVI